MYRSKYVICPMTKFEHIEDILFLLKENHELTVKEISEYTNKGTSLINNTLPIMEELQLIYRKGHRKSGVCLRKSGMDMAVFLKLKNEEKIKELAMQIIPRSKILNEAYRLLKEKQNFSNYALGMQLHKNLGITKKMRDERTYKSIGRTCKYLLDGLNLIPYEGGKTPRSKRAHRDRLKNKLLPSASINIILGRMDQKFNFGNEWKLTNPEQTHNEKQTIQYYVNTFVDLGLVEYIDHKNNIVKITEDGKKLKNTKENDKEKADVLQEILMKYQPVVDVVRMINNTKHEINYREIGNILADYNNLNWVESTMNTYGRRLLGWLRESNILEENGEWGVYHINRSFLQKYQNQFQKADKYIDVIETQVVPIEEVKPMITQKESTKTVDVNSILGNLHRYANLVLLSNNGLPDENVDKLQETANELIKKSQDEKKVYAIIAKTIIEKYCEYNNKKFIEEFEKYITDKDKIFST